MCNYLDNLIFQTQQLKAYRNYIRTLQKTYNLPECLPPLGLLATKLEALEALSEQYPNDVLILQNLVTALKEHKD